MDLFSVFMLLCIAYFLYLVLLVRFGTEEDWNRTYVMRLKAWGDKRDQEYRKYIQ